MIILILGDSRNFYFGFAKDLRVVCILVITGLAVRDIISGKYSINKYLFLLLPFLFSSIISTFSSPIYIPAVFEKGIVRVFSYFLLYFVGFTFIRHYISEYHGNFIKDTVMLVNLTLIIGLILVFISPSTVFYLGSMRYNGLMGNPNGIGNLVSLSFPLYFYYYWGKKNVPRKEIIFSFSLLVISLILCSSRNAIFSVSLFVFLFLALNGNLYRKLIMIFVAIPTLALLLYSFSPAEIVNSFGLQKYFRVSDFASGSGRVFAWRWALQLHEGSPWLGYGFFYEEYAFKHFMPREVYLSGHQGGVHNSYLTLLVNTGILGISTFFFFIGSLLMSVRNFNFAIPFLCGALFSAFFESWLASSLNAFTIFFIMMFLILQYSDKKEDLAQL